MAQPPNTEIIIDEITVIRRDNNILWMEILRVALQCNPTRTRMLLKEISKNDSEVTKCLGKL